jgi:hypothetical protein
MVAEEDQHRRPFQSAQSREQSRQHVGAVAGKAQISGNEVSSEGTVCRPRSVIFDCDCDRASVARQPALLRRPALGFHLPSRHR